jgi:hypothetical protein
LETNIAGPRRSLGISLRTIEMRVFAYRRFFAPALFLGLVFGAPSGKADKITEMNKANKEQCEENTRLLQERARELTSKGAVASADPNAVRQDLRNANGLVDGLQKLTQTLSEHPPKTEAEAEAYARILSNVTHVSGWVKQSLDRDLGVRQSSVMDRVVGRIGAVVDTDALFRFGGGSPNSIPGFEGSTPRPPSHLEIIHLNPDHFFGAKSQPQTVVQYAPATVKDFKNDSDYYGSLPGGVVFEGPEETDAGLDNFRQVHYEKTFNAFVLDDRAVFLLNNIPPSTTSLLCRAIAEDYDEKQRIPKERLGVSIGRVFISYGKVPKESDLAQDLMLTDKFLADIVFARNNWIAGYKVGFVPEAGKGDISNAAVEFKFYTSRFRIDQELELVLPAQEGFRDTVYPVSKERAEDGGGKLDEEAIGQGNILFPEFEHNATHLKENIDHYRKERIVDRTFTYGKIAAFIRVLKKAQINLANLSREIDASN